jgi:hypothetical protein
MHISQYFKNRIKKKGHIYGEILYHGSIILNYLNSNNLIVDVNFFVFTKPIELLISFNF